MRSHSDVGTNQKISLPSAQSWNDCSKRLEASAHSMNSRGAKIDLTNRYQNLKWYPCEFGLPNFILRSCLFRALQRNRRECVSQLEVNSLHRIKFLVTGPTLNQSDLDVLIGFIQLAKLQNFARIIKFNERTFLRLIDRGGKGGKVGKSDRDWLRKTIFRLASTIINFINGSNEYAGALIVEYIRDSVGGCYVVSLNPHFFEFYGLDNWTKLNADVRNSLRGHPLAQFLYGFFYSNACTFPLSVQKLHDISGSGAGENTNTKAARNKAMSGWRDDTLRPALETLQLKLLQYGHRFEWSINTTNLVTVRHQPSKSQKRHLDKKYQLQRTSSRVIDDC